MVKHRIKRYSQYLIRGHIPLTPFLTQFRNRVISTLEKCQNAYLEICSPLNPLSQIRGSLDRIGLDCLTRKINHAIFIIHKCHNSYTLRLSVSVTTTLSVCVSSTETSERGLKQYLISLKKKTDRQRNTITNNNITTNYINTQNNNKYMKLKMSKFLWYHPRLRNLIKHTHIIKHKPTQEQITKRTLQQNKINIMLESIKTQPKKELNEKQEIEEDDN